MSSVADPRCRLRSPRLRRHATTFPLINGKKLSDKLGRIAFWLSVLRLQCHFPADALHRIARHAAASLYISGWAWARYVESRYRRLGAVILFAGFAVLIWDIVRPKGKQPYSWSAIRGAPGPGMATGDARQTRGECARSRKSTAAIRYGISRTSSVTSMKADSICPMRRKESAK